MPSGPGGDAAPTSAAPVARDRWRIPFWALQVLEYGVAFLLVTQSVHVGHGGLLVAGGALLFVLAVTADGPLGIFRVCGRRLHRILVLALAALLAAGCAVAALRPDAEGLVVVGAAVVALLVLASRTVVTGGTRGRRTGRGPVIDATATVVPPTGQPAPTPDDPDSAARKAGRGAGAAAAAGKRAVDEHRPQVEAGVRKTIRGAGRLAGRLAAPKPAPGDDRA